MDKAPSEKTEESSEVQSTPPIDEPLDAQSDSREEISHPMAVHGWQIISNDEQLENALERAREEDRLLLLLIRSKSCLNSGELEGELISREELHEESSRFVRLALDVDTRIGLELTSLHRVPISPFLLILNEDGTEAARLDGKTPTADLVRSLGAIADGRGTLSEMKLAASENPFDIHLAYELGRQNALRGNAIEAKRHFARIFVLRRKLTYSPRTIVRGIADVGRVGDPSDFGPVRSLVESDLAGLHEEVDTLIASSYFVLANHLYLCHRKDYTQALRLLEELRRRFPDSPEARRAGLSLAMVHHRLGSTTNSRDEMSRFLSDSARDPRAIAQAFLTAAEIDPLRALVMETIDVHLERHHDSARLWAAAARLLEVEGDITSAVAAARRASDLNPESNWQKRELARLEDELSELNDESSPLEEDSKENDSKPEASSRLRNDGCSINQL